MAVWSRWAALLAWAPVLAVGALMSGAHAQSSYSRGQNVTPAYEGWEVDDDGKRFFVFGFLNRNWEEEVDVPVGPDNQLEPGPADQGQPTHFQPRRNRFMFRVPVPEGFSDTDEMVWTLTTRGKTEKAYASLRLDYYIDELVRASEHGALGAGTSDPVTRANEPPALHLETKTSLSARVGQPVELVARASDDGVPVARDRRTLNPFFTTSEGKHPGPEGLPPEWQPPLQVTVDAATGLRVSWFVHRGAGKVEFDPHQIKVWEDNRTGANSPWAPRFHVPPPPEGGKWVTRATFSVPGTYVLRCRASDGALDVDADVTVTVQ